MAVAIPPLTMNTTNRHKLFKLMEENELTAKVVAKMVKRSEKTVYSWRSNRNVPHWVVPFLREKLSRLQK